MTWWRSLTIMFAMTFALLISASSSAAEEFYEDRVMKIIVSFFPGGGYDSYSRVIARHLPKHIPGRPSIIVQSMPGAGSVIGANYLYRVAPKNGAVVGTFGPTQIIRQALGLPGVEFESTKFNWLAAANAGDVTVCIARSGSGVANLDDAVRRTEPLVVAATAPGSGTSIWARSYKDILGANFKIVRGYKGTSGIRAALERGEVDGGCWQWSSVKVTAGPMLAERRAVVFTQMGLTKIPELPHVENALERATSKFDRSVLTALLTESSMGRPYAAPPGVPDDRVRILRRGFMGALRDPEFLAEAKRLGLAIDPLPGEELEKLVNNLENLPRRAKDKIKELLQ